MAAWLIKNATSVSLLNSLMPVLYICIAIFLTPECDVLLLILFCHTLFFVCVMVCHGLHCKCGSTVFLFFAFSLFCFKLRDRAEKGKFKVDGMSDPDNGRTMDGKEN